LLFAGSGCRSAALDRDFVAAIEQHQGKMGAATESPPDIGLGPELAGLGIASVPDGQSGNPG
jgi:hypothetical protein